MGQRFFHSLDTSRLSRLCTRAPLHTGDIAECATNLNLSFTHLLAVFQRTAMRVLAELRPFMADTLSTHDRGSWLPLLNAVSSRDRAKIAPTALRKSGSKRGHLKPPSESHCFRIFSNSIMHLCHSENRLPAPALAAPRPQSVPPIAGRWQGAHSVASCQFGALAHRSRFILRQASATFVSGSPCRTGDYFEKPLRRDSKNVSKK